MDLEERVSALEKRIDGVEDRESSLTRNLASLETVVARFLAHVANHGVRLETIERKVDRIAEFLGVPK